MEATTGSTTRMDRVGDTPGLETTLPAAASATKTASPSSHQQHGTTKLGLSLNDSPSLSPYPAGGAIDDDISDVQAARRREEEEENEENDSELALAMGAGEPIWRQISAARSIASHERTVAPHSRPPHAARSTRQDDAAGSAVEEATSAGSQMRGQSSNGGSSNSSKGMAEPRRGEDRDAHKPRQSVGMSLKGKVLHFTPSWFSVTMGTGVIASLLLLLGQIWGTEQYSPGFASFVRWPALVFLILNTAIFLVFSAAFTARYILFPKVLGMTLTHPQQSMFLGTVPMGLTTILVNISQLGTGAFDLGVWPSFVALGLWFLSAAVSLVIGVGIPWSIITYQKEHRFEGTTAALLLPIVPPVTVAAAGSVLIDQLGAQYPTLALTILVVSYLQLGIGLPLALMVQVLYLQRLILFKAPPREVIVSVFLPLGPCGQGGESALHLGRCALTLFPAVSQLPNTGVPQLTLGVGEALYGSGLVVALLLWALGMWWTIIGVATFLNEYMRGYVKFNMGFWSFTFPLASMCISTARIAMALDSLTFKIIYTIMTLANFTLWVSVAIPTVKGFVSGRLLVAPCIVELPIDPLTEKM